MKKFSDYLEMIQESAITDVYEKLSDLKNTRNYTKIEGSFSIRFYGKNNNKEVKIYQFSGDYLDEGKVHKLYEVNGQAKEEIYGDDSNQNSIEKVLGAKGIQVTTKAEYDLSVFMKILQKDFVTSADMKQIKEKESLLTELVNKIKKAGVHLNAGNWKDERYITKYLQNELQITDTSVKDLIEKKLSDLNFKEKFGSKS